MASSAENSNSFTGPTIPWSSVIPTQWRIISGRVLIVRFGDGASAFCWLEQRWLAPTDYQFTLSLVSPSIFLLPFIFLFFIFYFLLFIFSFFLFSFFYSSVLLVFKLFIYLFFSSFFLSLLSFLFFSFLLSPPFFNLCLFNSLSSEYGCFCNVYR